MKKVLVVYSSMNGLEGNSSKLAMQFIERLQVAQQCEVSTLELIKEDLPHLSSEEVQAWMANADARTSEQKMLVERSDNYIKQVKEADYIVIAAPMYNFSIPSLLKSWMDRLARAGITFKYTNEGPEGLITNKTVFVVSARGGIHAGTESDSQTPLMKTFFSFIGMDNIHFVYAEGLNMGVEIAKAGWEKSNEKIIELTQNLAA